MQYKVTLTPEDPGLTVAVSADSAQKFSAKVTELDLTDATATPDGNFIDKALEKLAQPLVDTAMKKIQAAIQQAAVGKSYSMTLDHPLGYTVQIEGQKVTLTASGLTLGTHEGHLLATGGIEVAP
ncbi:hypothetical protein [Saccharothrix texasensis]|uniref:Uncharacterized protein n=1 Tax=Saccharothrix texasensis TaxID=103734 RepID=A0A3N1GXG9_9PSEU|nr:hypothetical protein [Saccharothrix texasensis]ROP34839.1 hypothetical protein EDD40_0043 [Saccharothrix texasensis]